MTGKFLFTLAGCLAGVRAECPCLASFGPGVVGSDGSISVTLAGGTYSYPSTYGLTQCAAHDMGLDGNGLAPYCTLATPPAWCGDSWCYVDANNCDEPYSSSVYIPGTHYSYFVCGASNTFETWFNESGTHVLTDLITLVHGYVQSISDTLEDNLIELEGVSSPCSPPSSCPCVDCIPPTAAWDPVTSPDTTTPDMSLSTTTYKQRPGTSTSSEDAVVDSCLASILTSSFTRIAAKESDANRIGFEYYGSQSLGNYVQWPGMEDCSIYDPRYRPWYAAAASGPKDVVICVDTSGSMNTGSRRDMAQSAASMVVDTLTDVDYVTIIKFSSSAYSYSSTLVQATDANKEDIQQWITNNIDASGTTNFGAAFSKIWQVVDATATSSGCNRVVLFLSDGEPDAGSWDSASLEGVASKAASYSPPMHVLTYALGDGADSTKLKEIACAADGVFYESADDGPLADIMAGYYQILAPMVEPCKVRWIEYDDYYTGQPLLGACLASFAKEAATDATSCNGGLAGLGEPGDARVPKLLGVGCVDMNLIVEPATLEAYNADEWADFRAEVTAEMQACPRISLTEAQMETLRAEVGTYSVCDPSSVPDAEEDGSSIAAIIGAVAAIAVVLGGGCFFYKACCVKKASKPPPQPTSSSSSATPPAQQMAIAQPQVAVAQVPVVQAQVPVTQGVAMQGYPAQAGYPAVVPMGQVVQ